MTVHKSKDINQVSELKVHIWKQTHDEKNTFHEEFESELNLKDTSHTKHLGCILSNDKKNTKTLK